MAEGFREISGEFFGGSVGFAPDIAEPVSPARRPGRKKSKRKASTTRRRTRSGSKKTKRSSPRKTSGRRGAIRFTKNGQPFKIMADGKARFLKRTKKLIKRRR